MAMRWIFFPPVFSFVFLIIAAALSNRTMAVSVPPTVWGMTIAAYVSLCALSIFYIIKGDDKYTTGISMLTQGLMLSVMSMQFGVMFMSWTGLVLFLIGLMLIFSYATHKSESVVVKPVTSPDDGAGAFKRIDSLVEKLELPVCYTDNKGVIAGATKKMCETLGIGEDEVLGAVISKFLPLDSEEVVLESGRWEITQKKEGARYYFSLRQIPDERPPETQAPAPAPGGMLLYDNTTGLYTDEYRKIRGPEEVSRAQRYKRPLAGLLLSLTFDPGLDVKLTEEQETMLDDAFKTRVHNALRTTDCGFLMSEGRVQVLLPETPQNGAKTLLSRIITMPQDIFDEEIRTAVNPRVQGGMFFYNGTTRMEYGIFSAALEESFTGSMKGTVPKTPKTEAA